MNGQFMPMLPAAGSNLPRRTPWSDDTDAALLRLLAALALSCLLHAAVVFLPYLGKSTIETRFALSARQKPAPVINATLAPAGEHQHSAANAPPRRDLVPDLPAAEQPADAAQPAPQPRTEGAGLLPLAAPVYYSTDQLSKRPQPLAAADLDAPEIRPLVASGRMVLELWINEFGVVTDVTVEKNELPEVFSRTAVAAFKALRFVPGERNGQPVRTLMRIEVTYDDGRVRTF
jgi:protein TonB